VYLAYFVGAGIASPVNSLGLSFQITSLIQTLSSVFGREIFSNLQGSSRISYRVRDLVVDFSLRLGLSRQVFGLVGREVSREEPVPGSPGGFRI
jgi:hypothetical protein